MDTTNYDLLDGEVQKVLLRISTAEPDGDEYKACMSQLVQLYTFRLKEEEITIKEEERIDSATRDADQRTLKESELAFRTKELEVKMTQFNAEMNQRIRETELKEKELRQSKIQSWIQNITTLVCTMVPMAVSAHWMAKAMKFEETGCFRSESNKFVSSFMRLFKKG